MQRYENNSMLRIEKLLEKLLAHFEGKPEEKEIQKCLKEIRKDELKGGDFI